METLEARNTLLLISKSLPLPQSLLPTAAATAGKKAVAAASYRGRSESASVWMSSALLVMEIELITSP